MVWGHCSWGGDRVRSICLGLGVRNPQIPLSECESRQNCLFFDSNVLMLAIHITLINQFSFHSHLYLHLELEIHPLYLPSSTHPSIVYTNLLTLSRDLPPCLKPSIPGNSVAFYNPQGPHTVTPILTPFLLGINN